MKKNISWKFSLGFGVIAFVLGKILGGTIGDFITMLGTIVFLIGLGTLASEKLKNRKNNEQS